MTISKTLTIMLKILKNNLDVDFVLLSPPALTFEQLPVMLDTGCYGGYACGKNKRRERRSKERQSKNK